MGIKYTNKGGGDDDASLLCPERSTLELPATVSGTPYLATSVGRYLGKLFDAFRYVQRGSRALGVCSVLK
jgi:hypothetical protein